MGRLKLLRTVLSFNMQKLQAVQTYHLHFNTLARTVNKLTKRLKNANKRKCEVKQLEFVETFQIRFRKHRRKTILEEPITAINSKEGRKIIYDRYGKKTKIITVKRKK